jgi:hypothetical protein
MSKGLQIVVGVVLIVVGSLTSWAGGAGLVMAGISMIAGALLAPSLSTRIAARNVMIKSAVEPQEVVYGKVRKSGVVVWDGTSSVETLSFDNEYLWYVIAIAEHEIDSFESLWMDDYELNASSHFDAVTGECTVSKYIDSKGTPLLYAWFYTGETDQVADPNLVSAFSQWTVDHRGRNVAYVVVRMRLDTTKGGNDPDAPEKNVWYKGAPQNIGVTLKGAKVYDPRKDATNGGTDPVVVDPETDPPPHRLNDPTTWEWSENPILCRADYLKSTRFGPGLDTIDWETVIEEADWCDVMVTVKSGTQKRYTMNGIIDTGDTIKTIVEQLQSSDFGTTVFTPSAVTIKCGRWNAPTSTMDNSWLAGEMVRTSSMTVDNAYNAVRGMYADESAGYILEEFQPRTAPAYETEDGGGRVWEDITLSMTTNEQTAQRLAVTLLKRGRRQDTIKAVCNYRAQALVAHEVITWTGLGTYRVEKLESKANGTTTVWLREEVEDDWNYTISDLATPPIIPSVARYDDTIPSPENLRTSTVAAGIQVYWDLPPMDYVQYVELYSSATDDRATAVLITQGVQEGFYHELTGGDERYYWILSRGWNNLVSMWEPDSTQGVYGLAGAAGATGLTVAVINTFYRGATAPTQPLTDDGAYNFGTLTLTPPSIAGGSAEDWYVTPPVGTDPLYVSTSTFSIIGLTGTDETCVWTDPDLLVSDGQPGDSIHVANVYLRSPTTPATPIVNDGAYNFTTHLLTPPSIAGGSADNWSTTIPDGSDTLYTCTGSFSIAGNIGVDQTVTWTDPDVLVHDGAGYVPDFSPGYIGGTTDILFEINKWSVTREGYIQANGTTFVHPTGTEWINTGNNPFQMITPFGIDVADGTPYAAKGKFYLMYTVEDWYTRFTGVATDGMGGTPRNFCAIIYTDVDGWQAIDRDSNLYPFTPLVSDSIVAICEQHKNDDKITSIQLMVSQQGTEGLPGQSTRQATIFSYNQQTIDNIAGSYLDPLNGNDVLWEFYVPELVSDGDIAYSSTRSFTNDGAVPQDPTWSAPIPAFTRTDGVTGAIGQGTRNVTLYRKNSSVVVDDESGTYLDPIGVNIAWSYELPAITDNLDKIYSMTRILTTDTLPPEELTWSVPTVVMERIDGSDGIDSRAVSLVLADQTFEYDTDGLNPSPANALLTADATNITGTAYYDFLVEDISVQNTTSNTYTYVPQTNFTNMPQKVEVHVRENANTGTIVARDQSSALGLKDGGVGVDAITIVVSNEAHTIPVTNTGTKTYTGSGTDIEVWEGTDQVPYSATLAASPSYKVAVTASPNINPDTTPQTIATYTRQYSDASSLIATQASITFEITVKNAIGDNYVFTKVQSFSSSTDGTDGQNGLNGADGEDGAAGTDSRTVNLTMDDTSFEYDVNGNNPSPTTAIVTADSLNTTGTPYYQFFKNDVSVQNSTSNTYTYTARTTFALMPDKLEVNMREGGTTGTIYARDQITAIGIKPGSDGDDGEDGGNAVTVILSNDSHSLPATIANVITYTGSGTDIEAWDGITPVPYSATLASSPSFKVSASGSGITVGSASTPSTYIRRYGNHNSMTTDPASVTYTVTVKNSLGVQTIFTKKQSLSKSKQGETGLQGAAGVDGSAGSNARAVNLTMTDQSFEYTAAGASPSPSSATVTADALNTTGTPYYQFYKDDVAVQNTTSNTYTYTPRTSYVDMPDKIEVNLREGGTTGTIYARDQITANGIKPGADGDDGTDGKDAITTILTNEAHTLPTTNLGVVTYTGSGTDFEVWEGTTHVPVDTGSPYASPSFRVTTASDTSINVGSYSTPSTYVRRVGNHSSMIQNTATITYNIIVKNSLGVETTFPRTQTFAKSIEGQDGSNGDDGTDGQNALRVDVKQPISLMPADADGVITIPEIIGTDIAISGTPSYTIWKPTGGFLAAGFAVGDMITATGFTGDMLNIPITHIKITTLTDWIMTFAGDDGLVLLTDDAGEEITITKQLGTLLNVFDGDIELDLTVTEGNLSTTADSVANKYLLNNDRITHTGGSGFVLPSMTWPSTTPQNTIINNFTSWDSDEPDTIVVSYRTDVRRYADIAGHETIVAQQQYIRTRPIVPPPGAQVTGGRNNSFNIGSAATAYWLLSYNGIEYQHDDGQTAQVVGDWLLSGSNSDYEVRATLLAESQFATAGGTFDSWQALSSTRTWYVVSGAQAIVNSITVELKIRRTTDDVIVGTGSFVLTASWEN